MPRRTKGRLLATSSVLSYVLATQGVPGMIASAFEAITDNTYVFLMLLDLVLLVIGLVLDLLPAIIIFGPIFAGIAQGYSIDPVHFGIIFCVNLLIGLNTPPVGSGLFLRATIGRVRLEDLIREVRPFILVEIVALLIITYVPYLPRPFHARRQLFSAVDRSTPRRRVHLLT